MSNGAKKVLLVTESKAFVERSTRLVVLGSQPLLGVNVIVSCTTDQAKFPAVAGVTEKADCTELVSIGLLNFRTTDATTDRFVAACAGVWLMTTGSSGSICDWPM